MPASSNSPSAFDPITNPDNAKKRRDLVLSAMLTRARSPRPSTTPPWPPRWKPKVTPARQGCAYAPTAPYFCDYVLHLLLNNPAYGADATEREQKVFRGGLTIKTTLDPKAQKVAQDQVNAAAGANPDKWGAALVSVSRAPARSPTWPRTPRGSAGRGQIRLPDQLQRGPVRQQGNDLNGLGGAQPGSTMKPFTFAEWLNEGKSMNTIVNAAQRRYPQNFPWQNTCPDPDRRLVRQHELGTDDLQNAEDGYYRNMTVLYGLKNSINTATFASAAQVDLCGIQKVVDAVGLHGGLPTATRTPTRSSIRIRRSP